MISSSRNQSHSPQALLSPHPALIHTHTYAYYNRISLLSYVWHGKMRRKTINLNEIQISFCVCISHMFQSFFFFLPSALYHLTAHNIIYVMFVISKRGAVVFGFCSYTSHKHTHTHILYSIPIARLLFSLSHFFISCVSVSHICR